MLWLAFRKFPLDMAGYAVNVRSILDNPEAWYGRVKPRNPGEEKTSESTLETAFLEHFATRETVECRGTYKEVCTVRMCIYRSVLAYSPWTLIFQD